MAALFRDIESEMEMDASQIRSDYSGLRFRKGLSLTELLVSMGVIGLWASLLLPAIQQAREAARQSQCQNNLRQIGIAAHAFYDQHGFLPTRTLLRAILPQMGDVPTDRAIESNLALSASGATSGYAMVYTPASYLSPSDSYASRLMRHLSYAVNRG